MHAIEIFFDQMTSFDVAKNSFLWNLFIKCLLLHPYGYLGGFRSQEMEINNQPYLLLLIKYELKLPSEVMPGSFRSRSKQCVLFGLGNLPWACCILMLDHHRFLIKTLPTSFANMTFKVHIFLEGHQILRNLHPTYICPMYGGDFAKFGGLLRIFDLYVPNVLHQNVFSNWIVR